MLLKGTPIGNVTEDDLQTLIDAGVVEDENLEYKRELPGSGDEAKKEFLKEATALANASGGVIIYGMAEDDGQADGLNAIPNDEVDDEIGRLENLLKTSVDPRIHGHEIVGVDVQGGAVILVGVPHHSTRQNLNEPSQNRSSPFIERVIPSVSEESLRMKRKRPRDACRLKSFPPSIEEILRRSAPLNDSNREFEESNDFCHVLRFHTAFRHRIKLGKGMIGSTFGIPTKNTA